ncbi:MAG: DNA internalization-related competence protein ComEC/Rec2 [Lonepinella koalarum]|nr:DNA internalization-related competence protein ComEC/Rec2 [Lonepinella koalarum]
MQIFQLESLFVSVILGAISIYIAPEFLLLSWQKVLPIMLCCGLLGYSAFCCNKTGLTKYFFALVTLLAICGYMHDTALNALSEAKAVAALPKKMNMRFKIEEIHHQQDYQAAVIRIDLITLKNQRIYARFSLKEEIKQGDIWQGELQLRAISSRLNKGGFDRQQWYFSKGISGYATIKSAVKIGQDLSWRDRLFDQAKKQTNELSQQGLLLALSFGERAWLSPLDWKIYQKTNTAHLIAISGLHIGLAALIGFGLARGVQFFIPVSQISPLFPLIGSGLFALFYAQLAGFAIPTFRAVVALLIVIGLHYCRYYFTPWRLFFIVISILLLSDPLMVLSDSFMLSVGAVGSLILWYQLVPLSYFTWTKKELPKTLKWGIGLIHLQIGLFWLFMPLQLTVFNGFSLYSIITNLIAVPLFSFLLVPLVLFAVLTQGCFYSWEIADKLAQGILSILSIFESGWLDISYKTQGILSVVFALILLYMLWRRRIKNKIPLGIWILVFGVLFYGLGKVSFRLGKNDEWRIETLDIGQGLATLIVKNGRGVLYDTGAAWQNGSMAELEILPYLRREGIILDKLILSHDDNDHAGGANAVLSAFPQVEFISPSYKNYNKTDRTFCNKGLNFHWQGLDFLALSPLNSVNEAKNPDSCVIVVNDGKSYLLLTGDADLASEQQILPDLNKIHVLQVGHHGSKTSTGAALLTKIQPNIALISSGRWNPWHFPHKNVVERLEAVKSAVYNTAVSGQISVIVTAENRRIETARHQWSPWYRQLIIP